MQFDYNDPIITKRRKGTSDDPFIDCNETHVVENGKVILTEIPDPFTRVIVTGANKQWYEIQSGIPKDNEYLVDYKNKIVTFNTVNNGLQLNFSYKGTGLTYVPTSMIYTKQNNGEIVETLKQLTDSTEQARDTANEAADNLVHLGVYDNETQYKKRNIVIYQGSAYMAITDTQGNPPTDESHWKKLTAFSWKGIYDSSTTYNTGDFVQDVDQRNLYLSLIDSNVGNDLTDTTKWKKLISIDDIVNTANQVIADANAATINANNAANNANTEAANAQNQANYAKTQGDYAKEQGDAANLATNNANNAATAANEAANNANIAADNANTAANNANDAANNANNAATIANEAANNANTAANNANTQATNAQNAAQSANDAATNANNAADNANTQAQYAQQQGDYAKEQGDYAKQVAENNIINWLTPVNTYADIATTYPNPQIGDLVQTIDDSKIYRWDGTQWVFVQKYDANAITDVQNKLATASRSPNVYEWTATAGQVTYTLPEGTSYDPTTKWLEVFVGGAPVPDSLIQKDSPTQFTLLVDPSDIPDGVKVIARWVETYVPATSGHASKHYENGIDPIDVTKLMNYKSAIDDRIGILYNNVIHVKEYGNDKQAIINAIAAAQDGDRVEISKGEYLIDSPIQVNKKISIGGKGKLRLNAHGIYALVITSDGVEVDGLNIINPDNFKNINRTRSGGIQVKANNVTITRCHLDGLLHPVIVEADGEYKGTIISNNIITNCIGAGREDMGDGICVFGSEVTIVGNYITCKPGEDARIGINFEGLPSFRTDGGDDDGTATIVGNVIKGPFRRAIHVEGVENTTVAGNVCKGTTWWGIFVYGNGVTITGNSVIMPTSPITVGLEWNPEMSGIQVYSGEGIVVSNNIIKAGGAGGAAIRIKSGAKGSVVNGNQIVGDAQSLGLGIYVDNSNDHIISNNKVKNGICTNKGFYAFGGQRLKVTNNYIEGCQSNGLYFENSHNCSIKGNTAINNVGAGIKIVNSNDCIVEGNYCSDNQPTKTQTYGIYTWDCDNLLMYGNDVTGNLTSGISLQGGSDNPIAYGNKGYGNRVFYGTAAPTSGTYQVGDKVYNTNPTAGGYEGWICVAAGSPGTWKGFGAIQS